LLGVGQVIPNQLWPGGKIEGIVDFHAAAPREKRARKNPLGMPPQGMYPTNGLFPKAEFVVPAGRRIRSAQFSLRSGARRSEAEVLRRS
jgi:hypothetical protein